MLNIEIRLIIFFAAENGEAVYRHQKKKNTHTHTHTHKTLGTDCGSDHELLIAKFRVKLKKVGKTTRPFRYNPNQIP